MSNQIWTLDPTHSQIEFKVRHMMISNVKGNFTKFDAKIDGEDFTTGKISAQIDVASINTKNDERDNHLRSADFFDVEKYPEITFEGKSLTKVNDEDYKLTGALTIKDVTKDITLNVEYGGLSTDPWGNEKAGFTVTGKIIRSEYGLTWNAALETGGVMVSDEVKLEAELEFAKKAGA